MPRSDYWIKIFDSLPGHWKTRHVKDAMGWSQFETVGFLTMFWLQVASDAPNGVLDGLVSINDILKAVGLKNKSKKEKEQFRKVTDAMLEARLLENTPTGFILHDWNDGGGKLQKTRDNDATRQQEYRDSKKGNALKKRHTDVTPKSKSKELETPPNPPQAGGGSGEFCEFQQLVADAWREACATIPVDVVNDNKTTQGIGTLAKRIMVGGITIEQVRAGMGEFLRQKYHGTESLRSKMAAWGLNTFAKNPAAYQPKGGAAASGNAEKMVLVEFICGTCGHSEVGRFPAGGVWSKSCPGEPLRGELCPGVMTGKEVGS